MHYREFAHGLESCDGFGGCHEFDSPFGGEARKGFEEVEYAAGGRLHVAECLHVEEDADDLFFGGCGGNPVHVLVGGEGNSDYDVSLKRNAMSSLSLELRSSIFSEGAEAAV